MFVFVSSPYHLKLSYMGTTTNLQIVLTTPTNLYLNQATQKIFAKFSYSKRSRKISNPKK